MYWIVLDQKSLRRPSLDSPAHWYLPIRPFLIHLMCFLLIKILHYRKLKTPCDRIAKALEKSKIAVSTQLPDFLDEICFSMRLEQYSWYFLVYVLQWKRPEKRYYFVKTGWGTFYCFSHFISLKYFSLPLVCLWILPWAGTTWLQPLVMKRFSFKVQNIVHKTHIHLHTCADTCTV